MALMTHPADQTGARRKNQMVKKMMNMIMKRRIRRRKFSENARNSNYQCYWGIGSRTPNSQAQEEGNMKARAINQNYFQVACWAASGRWYGFTIRNHLLEEWHGLERGLMVNISLCHPALILC